MAKKISEINNLFFKINDCKTSVMDDKRSVYLLMNKLSALFNSIVLKRSSIYFKPHGLTVCFFLSSSHIIYSSWPEYKTVLFEIATCGELPSLRYVRRILKSSLRYSRIHFTKTRVKLL